MVCTELEDGEPLRASSSALTETARHMCGVTLTGAGAIHREQPRAARLQSRVHALPQGRGAAGTQCGAL